MRNPAPLWALIVINAKNKNCQCFQVFKPGNCVHCAHITWLLPCKIPNLFTFVHRFSFTRLCMSSCMHTYHTYPMWLLLAHSLTHSRSVLCYFMLHTSNFPFQSFNILCICTRMYSNQTNVLCSAHSFWTKNLCHSYIITIWLEPDPEMAHLNAHFVLRPHSLKTTRVDSLMNENVSFIQSLTSI